jgi:FkbM family methyltransferase
MLAHVKNSVRNSISRPTFQPLWSKLLKLCHAGMNCGGGQSVEDSGELGALAFAVRNLKLGSSGRVTLFDVGAHDGEYLQAVLPILGAEAQVFSFEPQSSSFRILQDRFAANAQVTVRNLALGKQGGTVSLFSAGDSESTASLHKNRDLGQGHSEIVEITTIDDICEAEGIDRIHVLKIDTEGHEMEVLSGASRMLEQGRIDTIQFEFGETFLGTGYYFRDAFDLLSPHYTIYRILRSGLSKVSDYTHDLEIYKLTNFLCIRK